MTRSSLPTAMLFLLALFVPAAAAAQDGPDIRDLRPFLMLVVDTSGSMERLPKCACTTSGCAECLPKCGDLNTPGIPPAGTPTVDKKNRWATTLEALTGTFIDFQCERLDRTQANGATYDRNYTLPYHQPWDCAYPQTATDNATETRCDYDAPGVLSPLQNKDGVLDSYASRVRFGLMTFDGEPTYAGSSDLVDANLFSVATSNSVQGIWSYAGPKRIHYPGCDYDYMMDTGARNNTATEGGLISLDSCATPPCDSLQLNGQIQDQLLRSRPFGGTPIAASLDDLYFHLNNDLSDTFGSCRNRFAMLITDGRPDDDYRSLGCGCLQNTNPDASDYCGPPPKNIPGDMKCPYPLPEDAARDLVLGRGSDSAQIQQLFVVGLAVDDTVVKDRLNAIALEGGGTPYPPDNNVAFFADDLSTLIGQLSDIIDNTIQPISRTIPVSASSKDGSARQYMVSTGFELPGDIDEPWSGVIERRRFTCNGSALQEEPLSNQSNDRFHTVLNTRSGDTRVLYTPNVPYNLGVNTDSHLYHASSGAPCGTPVPLSQSGVGVTGCKLRELDSVDFQDLGLATTDVTLFDDTIDWMYGKSGSPRADKKLGDIYHSIPVIVGTPEFDTPDAAFNEFRATEIVADRPLMLYVGSNDGILHAFSMEAYVGPSGSLGAGPYNGVSYGVGEEVWGFVPPMFLNNLPANLNTHQFMVDGSPVAKDVFFSRAHSSTGLQASVGSTVYHTVLVSGLRNGGAGYFAMDVTNPSDPHFLWQFTDADMGLSYGQPAIVQAVYDPQGGTDYQERAVAILPGGKGNQSSTGPGCVGGVSQKAFLNGTSVYSTFAPPEPNLPIDSQTPEADHRPDLPCYASTGRALYFVDVETGELIKKITGPAGPVLPAPIVSTPVMHQSAVGTLASEGYVVDQEGVVWRIDISSVDVEPTDPRAGWTMRPYHDLFWDDGRRVGGLIHGEPSYERPLLSLDSDGRLVVMVATGDTDDFSKATAENRVASLTTIIDPNATLTALTPDDYRAVFNWEKRVRTDNTGLVPSELVTGSMSLDQGRLFFASFISVGSSGDACDLGKGRIFAVDYRLGDIDSRNGSSPATFAPIVLSGFTDPDIAINVDPVYATDNRLVMGLGVTQRPSCALVDTGILDVWGQSVPVIDTFNDPARYLVAQVSSEPNSGLQRLGSKFGSLQVSVENKRPLTQVLGWATSTD